MKTYFYTFVFSLALLSAPSMAAPPNPDPELVAAQFALDTVMSTPRQQPFLTVQCEASSGGSYLATFSDVSGPALMIQAVGGSAPRWQVVDQQTAFFGGGNFTSKGKGYQPWKREVKNLCVICMSDIDSCINN